MVYTKYGIRFADEADKANWERLLIADGWVPANLTYDLPGCRVFKRNGEQAVITDTSVHTMQFRRTVNSEPEPYDGPAVLPQGAAWYSGKELHHI